MPRDLRTLGRRGGPPLSIGRLSLSVSPPVRLMMATTIPAIAAIAAGTAATTRAWHLSSSRPDPVTALRLSPRRAANQAPLRLTCARRQHAFPRVRSPRTSPAAVGPTPSPHVLPRGPRRRQDHLQPIERRREHGPHHRVERRAPRATFGCSQGATERRVEVSRRHAVG
jgi:hypothetical protein